MSSTSQGPGWWQASDGRWYQPELHPDRQRPPPPPPPPAPATPGALMAFAQPPQASYAPVPYQQPMQMVPLKACFACGNGVYPTAAVCPRCGTMLGTPKDKTVAVLLAVFLAPWNWVYTYKRDASKFWVGLVLMVLGAFLAVFLVGFLMIIGVWLWAVIDASSKPDMFYRQFPAGPG